MKTISNEIGTLNRPGLLRETLLSVAVSEARGEKRFLTVEQFRRATEIFFGYDVWQEIETITPREVRARVAEEIEADKVRDRL